MAEANSGVEKRLRELHCAFTWDMPKYRISKKKTAHHDDFFLPLMTFTRHILKSYAHFLQDEYDVAAEEIIEAEKLIPQFTDLKNDVAQHILEATKAHLSMKKGNLKEVENILNNIKNIDEEKYLSLKYEFKTSFWVHACDYIDTTKTAIELAKDSLKYDQKNATSHFLLGKSLRTLRRLVSCFGHPEKDELYHFSKAYELDKNPLFGLFLGQAYKENRDRDNANIIFHEIYNMDIQCPSMNLRMALYFLQNRFLDKAEKCLSYVESITPEDSMFQHYMGLFLMKKEKFREAAVYFRKTWSGDNIGADLAYAKCMRKMGTRFDFIAYFLEMLEKYKDKDHKKQEILLHLAFSYFNIKRDIRESVKYFSRAFQIAESQYNMERYHDPLTDKNINVYQFLRMQVFPKMNNYLRNRTIDIPDDVIADYETLKEMCENHR